MQHKPHANRRAFTIIELMVVVTIIALVIAIIVPALSGVRTSARKTRSQTLLKSVGDASSLFQGDNQGRAPGYFSPRQMGQQANIDRGFTAMDNALLDLCGGMVPNGDPNAEFANVGPFSTAASNISVDLSAYGSKKYFTPAGAYWQMAADPSIGGNIAGRVSAQNNDKMPVLVDDFKNPVLMWVADDSQQGPYKTITSFAKKDSGAAGDDRAVYYWASNSAMLSSTSLGTKGKSQVYQANGEYSLLGRDVPPLAENLTGLLGHPSYPYRDPANLSNPPLTPAKTRGNVVLHSAGPDGMYFGSNDRGAKQFGGNSPIQASYKFNYVTPVGDQPLLDKDGKPTNIDIATPFDDLFMSAGS